MRNCPFNPAMLVLSSYKIKGFVENVTSNWYINGTPKVYLPDAFTEAMEEVASDYEDWDSDFGSSDYTYALQSFINHMIGMGGLSDKFKTDFTPSLSVVPK